VGAYQPVDLKYMQVAVLKVADESMSILNIRKINKYVSLLKASKTANLNVWTAGYDGFWCPKGEDIRLQVKNSSGKCVIADLSGSKDFKLESAECNKKYHFICEVRLQNEFQHQFVNLRFSPLGAKLLDVALYFANFLDRLKR
jgi:hypothetical protein